MIYLDTAATTKPSDSVLDAIRLYIESDWYNPSSLYNGGVKVKNKIEMVRSDVAKCINADAKEVYFTSGSSESNNWVIRGFDDFNTINESPSVIITTFLEHKSILNAIDNPALKSDICLCASNLDGTINMTLLKEFLERYKNYNILVSVIMANNEIGTVQDIKAISDLVHSYNGILHTDATQAFGHIPIDVKDMGIDLLSASSQKLGGLKGTGFLYKSENVKLFPLIYGEQERELRGGTENVVGIVALGEAIKNINYDNANNLKIMRDYMISELESKFGCKLNGSRENRLPNNINVTFPQNITGESLLYLLDMCSICVSTGSACNAHSIEPSHVLKGIGLSTDKAYRTIRITLFDGITKEQINDVISEIDKQIKLLTL